MAVSTLAIVPPASSSISARTLALPGASAENHEGLPNDAEHLEHKVEAWDFTVPFSDAYVHKQSAGAVDEALRGSVFFGERAGPGVLDDETRRSSAGCPLPRVSVLKPGAQVLLMVNMDLGAEGELKLVNGSMGKVDRWCTRAEADKLLREWVEALQAMGPPILAFEDRGDGRRRGSSLALLLLPPALGGFGAVAPPGQQHPMAPRGNRVPARSPRGF